ncbi:MAG: hypothetical protein R3F56_25065 [Planctomycetota bacterium]
MRVALITCRQLPEPDPDQEPLLVALRQRGVDAVMHAWDGDGTLDGFDLGILRSCWNYHLEPERFLAWLDAADRSTRLLNPTPVLRWNLHKRYLQELGSRGLPVVPTVFVERGAARRSAEQPGTVRCKASATTDDSCRSATPSFAAILDEHGWSRAVIKPSVSAASFRTRVFARDEAEPAQAFLAELLLDRDAMVQRYVPSVEQAGEKALVWIDGEWTHGVHKRPRFQGDDEQVSPAVPLDDRECALGARALATVGDGLLYARLDVISDDNGELLVSELELLEPSLFLQQHPPALQRLSDAIAGWGRSDTRARSRPAVSE